MTETDIKDLRVLLVGGRPASVQVLRTAFGLLGLRQVVAVQESARAIDALRGQTFHAIFCDAAAEKFGKLPFPQAARRAPGILNPMTPLFLIYSHARRRHVEQARDSGVTDVLTHPISAATIARKLILAIAAPRPFIAAPTFFGPDRRSQRTATWNGEDRRKRAARKTRVSLPEARDIALI
jgi:two-component system chemotaxis response regulator CheY